MKNKYVVLLKNSLINTYKLRSISLKKCLLIFALFGYVFLSLILFMNSILSDIYESLMKANLSSYYLTIVFALTSIFSFFFTIFSAKNSLFECKDNALLFSLPIKKQTILLSRMSMIVINNFIVSLVVIIPGVYVYLINNSISIGILLIIFLLTLFTSVIPTILSCLFGYLIAFITSRFKSKNLIEIISYMIFILIYMLVMYKGNLIFDLFISNPKLLTNILKFVFFPIYLINLSITNSNLIYIFLYVLINILTIYVFVTLLSKIYYKLIASLNSVVVKSDFKYKNVKKNTQLTALIKKEEKRYLTSAVYVFNTAFGVIILLIFSVASLFSDLTFLLTGFMGNSNLSLSMMLLYFIIFIISLCSTTSSSISIEKENFWILKMLPIKPNDVFKAKKTVNLILLVPSVTISLVLFLIKGYITFNETIVFLLISVLYCIIISNFGLLCNLMFPKFDASNDTVIVKQSLSSTIGVMIPMIFSLVGIIVINTLNLQQPYILTFIIILFTILVVVTQLVLNSWGIKKYKKLG